MNNALEKGYDELIRNHKTDYTALFNRVQLQINPRPVLPICRPTSVWIIIEKACRIINWNSCTISSDAICS